MRKNPVVGRRADGRPILPIRGGAPSAREIVEKRLADLDTTINGLFDQRGAVLDKAMAENRGMTDAEKAEYDSLGEARTRAEGDRAPLVERLAEIDEQEKRERQAADTRALQSGGTPSEQRASGGAQVTDPEIYIRGNKNGNSYFRDLANSRLFEDSAATDRLVRNGKAVAEKRALGNTNAAGGSGGEFAPPVWLVDDYIKLIRAGRVTANLYQHMEIPPGTSNVNLPTITGGTTTAIQSTQNSALSQTDLTTGSVQTGFATIGGKQVVSQQLLDQSAIPFDEVITQDLAADYGLRVGTQVYTGTGAGTGTNAVINGLGAATYGTTTTWTQGSPTVAGFYGQANKTLAAFMAARLAPPTHWLMAPRRWYWLCAQVDSSNRPLVVPNGVAYNPIAIQDPALPYGTVGTFLGLPVVIDPVAPINLGGGTNQDNVYLIKADDLWLFESPPQAEVFRETYADSVGVLFRLYGYVGAMLNRHTQSIAVITGTGLVTPTFAS